MANHHLLEALAHRDPKEAEQVFIGESALYPPDPATTVTSIKRVAIFAEAFLPKVDGVSKTAYLTLRHLQQTGREVLVFAPDIAPSSVNGSRVVALPSVGIPAAPESRLALPHPAIVNYLNEFQPDLIHLFSPALLSVSGMLVGRQNRIPVIATYQTDLPSYSRHYGFPFLSSVLRDWLRYMHNGCHLTLVPSNWTMRELRQAGHRRMRKWGRGVDGRRYNPNRRSREWRERLLAGRDPDSLLCIYVGRLANEKRIDLLLEAARTPGIALTIIGDGALREDLEVMFAGTGTYFTGYLYGDDLADAYASADAFMFTGMSETFGQVVQEAMASGLPAIIINQGGITDQVTHGVNGFVCPADPSAFAQAACILRDNEAMRRQMSVSARRFAEQHPWETLMEQLEGYYGEAVEMNSRFNQLFPQDERLNLMYWKNAVRERFSVQ